MLRLTYKKENNAYISFDNIMYRQIDEILMGSPL